MVGTTALFKRLDSFQTSTKVQKYSVQVCVWRRLLFCSQNLEITWLLNFSSIHSYESLWMDGWFGWMAASVLSAIHQ